MYISQVSDGSQKGISGWKRISKITSNIVTETNGKMGVITVGEMEKLSICTPCTIVCFPTLCHSEKIYLADLFSTLLSSQSADLFIIDVNFVPGCESHKSRRYFLLFNFSPTKTCCIHQSIKFLLVFWTILRCSFEKQWLAHELGFKLSLKKGTSNESRQKFSYTVWLENLALKCPVLRSGWCSKIWM